MTISPLFGTIYCCSLIDQQSSKHQHLFHHLCRTKLTPYYSTNERFICKPKVFNSSEKNKAKRCEEKKTEIATKKNYFALSKFLVGRKEGVLWLDGKLRGIWTLCIYKCIYEKFAIWHISAMSTSSINNNSNPTCSPLSTVLSTSIRFTFVIAFSPPLFCVPTIIVLFSFAFCL